MGFKYNNLYFITSHSIHTSIQTWFSVLCFNFYVPQYFLSSVWRGSFIDFTVGYKFNLFSARKLSSSNNIEKETTKTNGNKNPNKKPSDNSNNVSTTTTKKGTSTQQQQKQHKLENSNNLTVDTQVSNKPTTDEASILFIY